MQVAAAVVEAAAAVACGKSCRTTRAAPTTTIRRRASANGRSRKGSPDERAAAGEKLAAHQHRRGKGDGTVFGTGVRGEAVMRRLLDRKQLVECVFACGEGDWREGAANSVAWGKGKTAAMVAPFQCVAALGDFCMAGKGGSQAARQTAGKSRLPCRVMVSCQHVLRGTLGHVCVCCVARACLVAGLKIFLGRRPTQATPSPHPATGGASIPAGASAGKGRGPMSCPPSIRHWL